MLILKRQIYWLNALCSLSLFFELGCGQPILTTPAPPALTSQFAPVDITPYGKSVDFDLAGSPVINKATIAISNKGKHLALMPAVFAKGGSGLNRESILSLIRSAVPRSDEQFAVATWRFVIQHTQHYCSAGAPGDPSNLTYDPMRLLHGYGFACCDQAAVILSWLWSAAGYPARVDEMTFHVVPEIYYQGAWHLYDPDHEVYYLDRDDKTVASLADVKADPDLVVRTADANGNDPVGFSAQLMADQYAAATPSYNLFPLSRESFWSLPPSQTLTLRSENLANSVFNGPSIDSPLGAGIVNSGQFDWDIDFSRPDWQNLTNSWKQVHTLVNGADTFLANTSENPGYVIYQFSSPFPTFSLSVSGIVYRKDSAATVNAYLRYDDVHWSKAFPLNAGVGGTLKATADLTSAAVGQYSYFVMLQLSGNAADSAQLAAVHITSEVQVAKTVFPPLSPGVVNTLLYQAWCPIDKTQLQDLCSPTNARDVQVSLTVE